MPPTPDEYRAGVLQLLQQQRGSLTSLIEQVDGTLAYDWQRGMGAAASLYGPILDQYAKDLAALRAANDDPAARLTLDWLTSRNAQLASIQQSVAASAEKYGQTAAQTITQAQSAATDMAASDAAQLTQRSLWPAVEGAGVPPSVLFNRPNPDAVAQWVGRAGNGHPLGDLFSGFGAEATQGARQAMMLGLLTGANPKAMASGIANALGISRSRATIISRTEVLGSYRSAAHETYRANSDVLDGWIWSAGGANPCAMCMGMDGLQFSLSEELVDHPCGKCAPIPVTKSWGDILGPLGIDSSDLEETSMGAEGAYETGPEKFARMSPQQQRAIIGTKTGYEAYQRGEVELKDFIGMRPGSDGFPATPYQKSLREMEIPTGRPTPSNRMVEPNPRFTRAEGFKPIERGMPIPVDEMPKWAQQSEASRAAYQIMRNGLPYNMSQHELPLLRMNLEEMLKGDLPLNVRLAALRQMDVIDQYNAYIERYVAHVTNGASTLGRAPEFVYKPSKELERALAAARAGEKATLEAGQQAATEAVTEAPKVASQEALDALAQAQAKVDELRALYEKAQSEGMRFYMPDGTDEAILRTAQAQARVDAEMGGRGAVIHYSSAGNPFTAQQEVDSFAVRAFGRALTRDELGGLVGAPEGSYVDLAGFEDSLGIQMHGPGWNPLISASESEYRADRTLSMGRNGLLRMENEHFHVRSDLRDQGIGARIFADQVMSLSHLGVDRIETFGAGFGERELGVKAVDVNGYYTWARFGYVGKISDGAKQVIREAIERGEIPAAYGDFTTVQQFMRTEEGRAVWQAYGQGLDLKFDLKPDSLSMRTMRAYLEAKGLL